MTTRGGGWCSTGSPLRLLVGWIDSAPWRRAPRGDRCCMGGPVHPAVHCRRSATPDDYLCGRHRSYVERRWPSDYAGCSNYERFGACVCSSGISGCCRVHGTSGCCKGHAK